MKNTLTATRRRQQSARRKTTASQPRARKKTFFTCLIDSSSSIIFLLLMPMFFHCIQPVQNHCQPAPNRCCKLRRRQSLFLLIWFSELIPIEPMFFTGVFELEPISKSQADCQLIVARSQPVNVDAPIAPFAAKHIRKNTLSYSSDGAWFEFKHWHDTCNLQIKKLTADG